MCSVIVFAEFFVDGVQRYLLTAFCVHRANFNRYVSLVFLYVVAPISPRPEPSEGVEGGQLTKESLEHHYWLLEALREERVHGEDVRRVSYYAARVALEVPQVHPARNEAAESEDEHLGRKDQGEHKDGEEHDEGEDVRADVEP